MLSLSVAFIITPITNFNRWNIFLELITGYLNCPRSSMTHTAAGRCNSVCEANCPASFKLLRVKPIGMLVYFSTGYSNYRQEHPYSKVALKVISSQRGHQLHNSKFYASRLWHQRATWVPDSILRIRLSISNIEEEISEKASNALDYYYSESRSHWS